ncbi:hypothetical protein Cni_G03028 [Canna indica]|uniref:ZF-HD dimerization-type domain-containing protein n=1 Tax=Canna indica TaxID=4628 RepID=A0AAQ3JQL2_9LILI|nr:hypothetical protein Cni_G03028 [Canna indica]
MDFDDHEEEEEEMDLGVESSKYGTVLGSSGRGGGEGCVGVKMGGGGESAPVVTAGMAVAGSAGHRKAHGSGGWKYRECLKNHAVGIGGYAVDGCGEFMPAGEGGSLDALRCAACGCHRNFHRKVDAEEGGGGASAAGATEVGVGYHPNFTSYYRTPAGYLHHHHYAATAFPAHRQAPLALPSTSGGGGYSREEQDDVWNPMAGGGGGGRGMVASGSGARKRFRTKFTPEQKDKMLAFAEWVGWRIQKHDEAAVQKFCEETCIKRHVFKVWMHNNKHTLGKKP